LNDHQARQEELKTFVTIVATQKKKRSNGAKVIIPDGKAEVSSLFVRSVKNQAKVKGMVKDYKYIAQKNVQ